MTDLRKHVNRTNGLCHRTAPSFARLSRFPGALLAVFAGIQLITGLRNSLLSWPEVFGDELNYAILSRYGGTDSAALHTGWVEAFPNYLYFSLFHSVNLAGDHFLLAAKWLNTVLFSVALFPRVATARLFLRRDWALLFGMVCLLGPVNGYTDYFMPEALYYLGFWIYVYVFLRCLEQGLMVAGVLGGIALGILSLVKPHAIVLCVSSVLVLIAIGFRFRSRYLPKELIFSPLMLVVSFVITKSIDTRRFS